jgi:hypothetical protein
MRRRVFPSRADPSAPPRAEFDPSQTLTLDCAWERTARCRAQSASLRENGHDGRSVALAQAAAPALGSEAAGRGRPARVEERRVEPLISDRVENRQEFDRDQIIGARPRGECIGAPGRRRRISPPWQGRPRELWVVDADQACAFAARDARAKTGPERGIRPICPEDAANFRRG